MAVENALCMNGGEGESSYANNSLLQVLSLFLRHTYMNISLLAEAQRWHTKYTFF